MLDAVWFLFICNQTAPTDIGCDVLDGCMDFCILPILIVSILHLQLPQPVAQDNWSPELSGAKVRLRV